jgi:hypothetical protein
VNLLTFRKLADFVVATPGLELCEEHEDCVPVFESGKECPVCLKGEDS